jgi:hypothetical protein
MGMNYNEFYYSRNFHPANHVMRVVIMYLREMFLLNSDLGYAVCTEDQVADCSQLSGLLIIDQNTWDTSFRGHIPSVIFQRGIVSFGGGLQAGDMSRVVNAGLGLPTTIMEIVSVPVVLSCIARQDTEAEALAFLVSNFLYDDKRWAKSFGLYGLQNPQISQVQIFQKETPSFMCTMSTVISVSRRYKTRLLPDVKLEEIALSVNETQMNITT